MSGWIVVLVVRQIFRFLPRDWVQSTYGNTSPTTLTHARLLLVAQCSPFTSPLKEFFDKEYFGFQLFLDSNQKHQKKTLQNIEICHHFRIDFASPPTEKETKGEKIEEEAYFRNR
jgi:hypothetical protein